MSETTVFVCKRGKKEPKVKIQLEIEMRIFDAYKSRSKEFQGGKYTPREIMQNVLTNNIDGVSST